MIIALDPVCWGSEHVPFSAGMLQTISAAFPWERLAFFGEQEHVRLVQQQMGPQAAVGVSWNPIRIPDRRAGYFKRLPLEIGELKHLRHVLPLAADNLIVFLGTMPSTLLALKLTQRYRSRQVPIQVVLHGGVSEIDERRSLRPFRRLEDIRTALTLWGRRNIQYLVLEEHIRDLILKHLPFLWDRVRILEHPLSPNEATSESTELQHPVRFGFLGLANGKKGFPRFVELAAKIVAKYPTAAEFHALGRYALPPLAIRGVDMLATKPVVRHLSREDFIAGLKQLHFTVFPYDLGHYALSPSGTLLDAIAWGKPIIAARIPLFENLFRKYGDVGYLFSTEAELEQIVETLVNRVQPSLYQSQVLNLSKARAERMPAALASKYRALCETAKNLSELTGNGTRGSCAFQPVVGVDERTASTERNPTHE